MFKKEYIELAKTKCIQELRPEYKFKFGDWLMWNNDSSEVTIKCELFAPTEKDLKLYVWLPTGDQLDEEIVKICKEKQLYYHMAFCYNEKPCFGFDVFAPFGSITGKFSINLEDNNPLIAKIKLLISLLSKE